ncbi:MAG TPA: glucosaminidase domain-containing protein [Bryobacteraceae bacterium]|jgi:flagellum-specific peptidoglycan hydrolase FlgJ|nr:glucosaminidase domain-containing protein [Bryobacteraceae bacterium]
MLSPLQLGALKRAAASAVLCERATKIPAELTVAQWALESGWGAHQPGNNCFGIKAYPGCFGIQSLETVEFVGGVRRVLLQPFATFPSLDACFAEHASLFSRAPYQKIFAAQSANPNLTRLISQVSAVYATDPNYSTLLLEIISMPAVTGALALCRA